MPTSCRKALILSILLIFFVGAAHAQQVNLKYAATEDAGSQHALQLCPGGDYMTITWHFADNDAPFIISRVDPQSLMARYTDTLQEFSRQHYRASMYAGNRLFIITSDKDGLVSRYEINDKNGTLSGLPVALFNMDGLEEYANFYSGSSPDGKYHFILTNESKKKDNMVTLQGVVMDQQMNMLPSFSYTTAVETIDFRTLDCVLANNGILSVIYGGNVKPKKDDYIPILYTVLQTEKGKVTVNPLIGLPSGQLLNFAWTPQNDQLQFTAFLSRDKKLGSTTIISGSYDPVQKKCAAIRETEIKKLLIQEPGVIRQIAKEGLPKNVVLLKTIKLSGGSNELVLEQNTDHTGSSYFLNSSTQSFASYRHKQNVYLVRLDKMGNPQWLRIITKNQDEVGYTVGLGIACIADKKDNVHLLFYDDRKNDEVANFSPHWIYDKKTRHDVFACVSITPDGTMKKQMIEQVDYHWRVMFENTFADMTMTNKFVGISLKPNHKSDPEHFFKIASYKLTSFEIN